MHWDGDGTGREGWGGRGSVSLVSGPVVAAGPAWYGWACKETALGKKGSAQGCRGMRDDEGRGRKKTQTTFLPCSSWLALSLRVCRLQEGTARGAWAVKRSNQAEGGEPLP